MIDKWVITAGVTCFSRSRYMGCGNVWGTVYLRHLYGRDGCCMRCGELNDRKKLTTKQIKKALGATRVIKVKTGIF